MQRDEQNGTNVIIGRSMVTKARTFIRDKKMSRKSNRREKRLLKETICLLNRTKRASSNTVKRNITFKTDEEI